MIPLQIRVLRKQRDWSQARLATESQLTQGVISRAEDPDYGNLTVNTLVRIASGFDCAFVGRFVPFSELCRWYSMLEDEDTLQVPSFGDDPALIERRPSGTAMSAGGDSNPRSFGTVNYDWAALDGSAIQQAYRSLPDQTNSGKEAVINIGQRQQQKLGAVNG